jgi:hypothetical protein
VSGEFLGFKKSAIPPEQATFRGMSGGRFFLFSKLDYSSRLHFRHLLFENQHLFKQFLLYIFFAKR